MGDEHLTGHITRLDRDGAPAPHPPALELDLGKYRAELADLRLTEEQETELLTTLWSIMSAFVELGFSVDVCAQLTGKFNEVSEANPATAMIQPSAAGETLSSNTEKGLHHDG